MGWVSECVPSVTFLTDVLLNSCHGRSGIMSVVNRILACVPICLRLRALAVRVFWRGS